MKKLRFVFVSLILFVAGGATSLFAQAAALTYDHRVPGDRSMTIALGPTFPLFIQDFAGNVGPTNLTLGANIGLDIQFYLTNNFKLGGELKGFAAGDPNNNLLFMVPITVKGDYEFDFFPFTIPVGLGAGICFNNYLSSTNINPVLAPTTGFFWNANTSWSFGANLTYWLIFDLYSGNPIPTSQDRIGNFLESNIAAIYHF